MAGVQVQGDPLELLVWWYRTINADASSNEERVQATRHMEEAKTMMGWGCGQAGLLIVEKATPADNLQYFGLHLIEHAVTNHYKDQTPDERTGLREKVFAIAKQLDPSSPTRVYEKVGQIAADMAKHDWPELWPDFMSSLLSFSPLLVTTTLRILLDDIKESTTTVGKGTSKWDVRVHLPAVRKRELITAVRSVSGDLLSYLHQQISNPTTRIAALKSVTSLIDLIDFALLAHSGVQDTVLQLFSSTDPTTDEWAAVCACVKEMCGQPLEGIAAVMQAWCRNVERMATPLHGRPCPDSETHQAVTQLAWCVESLLRFTRAVDYKSVAVGDLQQLIAGAMSLLQVPSLQVAATVVPAVLNLAKAGMTDGMENLPTLLREGLADHISDPENDEGLEFPNQSWSEDVYEYEDWKVALDTTRREGKLLLSYLTKAKPHVVLESISTTVEELSGQFAQRIPADYVDETGELVNCTRQAVAWESAAYVTSACLSAFYNSPPEAVRTLPLDRLVAALKKAFEVVTTDAVVIASQSALIGGVGCLYKLDPNLLNTALDKLFTLMKHRRDFERGSTALSHNTAEARKRVMQVFVRLASTLPNFLVPLMTPLINTIDGLVGCGELLNNELSSIFEGLVHVSNHMPEDAQKSILEIITKPSLAMLPELQHCASVQALASLLQTPQGETSSGQKILHLLSSLTGVFRHAKGSLMRPLAEEVVKPVLAMVQTVVALHADGKPALPVQLHPMLSPATAPPADKWAMAAPTPEQQLADLIEYGRSFLEEIQDVGLELLACISAVTPVLHEHYTSLNVGGIANPESLLALRSFFLRFSMHFLYNCPPQFVETSARFCAGLCRLISVVIPGWYARITADENADERLSHSLREVSMLSIDVLARVAKPNPTESDAVITNHLLANPLSLTALLLLPSCALKLPDPSIATKALLAFKKLLSGGLVQNQNIHQHLFVVFAECLQRVLQAKLKEGIEGLIGCDSKEDHLLDECVVIITQLYHHFCQVHAIFTTTLETAGVVTAAAIAQEIVAEPQEGRRVSAVRAALSKHVAGRNMSRNRTPVHLHIPSFSPLPQENTSCFAEVNLVPVEVR